MYPITNLSNLLMYQIKCIVDYQVTTLRYAETIAPVKVLALDYYEQNIPLIQGDRVTVVVGDQSGCSPYFGAIQGSTKEFMESGEATFSELKYSCKPDGNMTLQFMTPSVPDPAVAVVFFQKCLDGDYGATYKCTNPDPEKNKGDGLFVEEGRWRFSYDSYTVQDCFFKDSCLGNFTAGDESCEEGYMGPYCSLCKAGYYVATAEGECTKCEGELTDSFIKAVIIVPILLFVLLIVGLLYWLKNWTRRWLLKRQPTEELIKREKEVKEEQPEWMKEIKVDVRELNALLPESWRLEEPRSQLIANRFARHTYVLMYDK